MSAICFACATHCWAQQWVAQAKQIADTGNYTYALTCYASAVKLDPARLDIHTSMFEAAVGHFSSGGKPVTRKELKDVDGRRRP